MANIVFNVAKGAVQRVCRSRRWQRPSKLGACCRAAHSGDPCGIGILCRCADIGWCGWWNVLGHSARYVGTAGADSRAYRVIQDCGEV